jgi:hypothetical protein
MSSSSPSQGKASRGNNSKSNGAGRVAAATQAKTAAAPSVSAGISEEAIARRAYEIYEREGRQPGSELQNWLRAEAELQGESKSH